VITQSSAASLYSLCSRLTPLLDKVAQRGEDIFNFNASMEVATGFQLLFQLIT
jgi:hypothetical protein